VAGITGFDNSDRHGCPLPAQVRARMQTFSASVAQKLRAFFGEA
jgi:hypothetical protein